MRSALALKAEDFENVGQHPLQLVRRTTMTPELHIEQNQVGLDLPVIFMATNDSERDLEVPRTGTVAKLRKHLCSLTSPETWPDGLSMQFVIASPWGPSVFLMPRTHVAAALLGQLGWDDPGVMNELNLLFSRPLEEAKGFLKKASLDLIASANEAMMRFESAEREIYDQDSAFALLEAGVNKAEHIADIEQRATPLTMTPRARRSSTRTLTVTPKAKVASKGDSSTEATPPCNTTGSDTNGSGVVATEAAPSVAVAKEAASGVADDNDRSG
jgi:hypothetical protein